MRKYILILLIFISYFGLSQTSPTYENITLRNQATIRQKLYLIPTISAPAVPFEGMLYADTDDHLYYYNGTAWVNATSNWTLTGSDISNNNAGTVTINGQTYAPDLTTAFGRLAHVISWNSSTGRMSPFEIGALDDTIKKQNTSTPADVADNTMNLVYWKMDWATAMLDNQSTATINNANIIFLGDSYTGLYGDPVKEIGGYKFGYGGGFEIFQDNPFNYKGVYCNIGTGWAATSSTSDADNWNDHYVVSTTDASVIKIAALNWNKLRLQYKTSPGYGTFTVGLNAEAAVSVDCNAAAGAKWFQTASYSNTIATLYSDTIYIRKTGTGEVRIFGYDFEMEPTTYGQDNKKGYLSTHIIANGGTAIRDRYLSRDTAEIHELLDTLQASLCVITYLDTATYSPIQSADSLIALLKILRPEMDILLVCPNAEEDGLGLTQRDSLKIIARARAVGFMDALKIGDYTTLAASGAITDGIHLSQKGKYLTFFELEKVLFTETPYNFKLEAWKHVNRGEYITFPRSQNMAIVTKDVGQMALTANNTLMGYRSSNFVKTTGTGLTYIGAAAGEKTSTGTDNVAIGLQAMAANTTGSQSVAIGGLALLAASTSTKNTMVGYEAGRAITTGSGQNVGVGYNALKTVTTGAANTAVGYEAGRSGTGGYNTFMGYDAGYGAFSGSGNVGVGSQSLQSITGANEVIAIGNMAALGNSSGSYNVALGGRALYTNATSSYNTAVGYTAGYLTTGASNVFLGRRAGYHETGSGKFYLSNDSTQWTNGPTIDGLLIYGDYDLNFINIFNRVAIGQAKNPTVALDVVGAGTFTTYLKSGYGSIADNDATPDVSGGNTFIYLGSANAVTLTDLDNPITGCYYTIIGNSDTYTVTIADAGNFKLSGASAVLGIDDTILLFCTADNYYVEISRSNN